MNNNQINRDSISRSILSDNSNDSYVFEIYLIIDEIGSGSFGKVYLAEYKKGGYVAVKVENRKKSSRIINEYKIYDYLNKKNFRKGLPKIYDFFQTPDYNMMFMQLLGPSLEDLFKNYKKKFKLSTVLLLAKQLLDLLESLHRANFIHRDIKPNNFLIGRDENKNQIYIMDFGLSKKYMNGGKHIDYRDNKSLIGTARYASKNMHIGIEPSRRDDLESVGYMLIYFLKGSLPWQGLKKKKGENLLNLIGDVKMCTSLDALCKNIPDCFKEYLSYCQNLKFDEEPNYKYLRKLFEDFHKEKNIKLSFEWI